MSRVKVLERLSDERMAELDEVMTKDGNILPVSVEFANNLTKQECQMFWKLLKNIVLKS